MGGYGQEFANLSLADKNAYLSDTSPTYKGMQPKDRAAYLNEVHYGSPPDQPPAKTPLTLGTGLKVAGEGVLQATSGIGEAALGLASLPGQVAKAETAQPESTRERLLGSLPGGMTLSRMVIDPMQAEAEKARQSTGVERLGRSVASGIPVVGPMMAQAGEQIGKEGLSGLPRLAGQTFGLTEAPTMARDIAEGLPKLGMAPEARATAGLGKVETALAPRVGRAGEAAEQMRTDLDVAKSHLSKIARDAPVSGPSILRRLGGKGDPEWFNETAGNIADYKQNLWQKSHAEPVARQGQQAFDTTNVRQRALAEIDSQDDAIQAGKAREWVDREIPRIKTVADADARIRRLNQEVQKLPEEYGPVGVRVRFEALKALRDSLDSRLEELGERGVKQSNREWGALRNIEDRLRERYYQETGKAAKASPIPDWAHIYMFAHPGGASLGIGLAAGRMLRPSPAMQLAGGMKQLGRAGLEPRPLPTAPPPAVIPDFSQLGQAMPRLGRLLRREQ